MNHGHVTISNVTERIRSATLLVFNYLVAREYGAFDAAGL